MKKIVISTFIIGLIGIIIGCSAYTMKPVIVNDSAEKDRLQEIKEKGVLTFASANDPPFVYINPETNKLDGIDASIISEIAKRLGINK